jgi:hypothetical protein
MQYEPIKRSLGRFFAKISVFKKNSLLSAGSSACFVHGMLKKALRKIAFNFLLKHRFLMPAQDLDNIPGV